LAEPTSEMRTADSLQMARTPASSERSLGKPSTSPTPQQIPITLTIDVIMA
jgi:hypothetical protein